MTKRTINIARIIVNVDNSALMVKRSPGRTNADRWEVPGGKVDFGESYSEAAVRELSEETGIDSDNVKLFTTVSAVRGEEHSLVVVYELTLSNKPKIHLSDEHSEYHWITSNELNDFEFATDDYKDFFESYLGSSAKESPLATSPIKDKNVTIYSDGGSRGNPGPSATGYVIYGTNEAELARGGTYLGIATNNQAEYLAVKEGLVRAKELGVKKVQYYLDSMLVVKQMSGEYQIKNKDLWPIHQSIKNLVEEFDADHFQHVKRDKNKVADSIVNEVLDKHEN